MWYKLCLNFFGIDWDVGVEVILILGIRNVFWRYEFCLIWLIFCNCFVIWLDLGDVDSVGGGGGNWGILCIENICVLNKFRLVV